MFEAAILRKPSWASIRRLERIGIVVFEDVMLWAAATSARRASRFTTTSMRTVGDFAFVAGAAGTRVGPVGGGNQFPDNLLKARARIRGWRPSRAGIIDAVVDHFDLLTLCVDTTAIFGIVTVPSDLPLDRIALGDKEVLNHELQPRSGAGSAFVGLGQNLRPLFRSEEH